MRELNQTGTAVEDSPVSPERLIGLLQLVHEGTINLKTAKDIFHEFYATEKSALQLVEEKGLQQVSDEGALEKIIKDVLDEHADQVEQYRGGKGAVIGYFVGQVMKASKGKANPQKVNELLKRVLSS